MKQFNTQAKRELTLEVLSEEFIAKYNELLNQYYRNGKVITLDGYYVYISEGGQKARCITFNTVEYKKFLQRGLRSVCLTNKKRNVFLGVNFGVNDGCSNSDCARDLIGFSSSY